MINQNQTVTVAFGVDAAYAPHLAVTIASLVANAPGGKFNFYVATHGLPDEDRRKIASCASGQNLVWLDVGSPDNFADTVIEHTSRATYYRLVLPDLLPEGIGRVVYLDSDLAVLGDVRDLASVDLGGKLLGAVFDPAVDVEDYTSRLNLKGERLSYFNAGVLVLEMDKIREQGLFKEAMRASIDRIADMRYGDQCALNLVFWNNWARLDPTWNTQRRMVAKDGRPVFATPDEMRIAYRPKIVHFTEEIKPWSKGGYHPYIWTYFKYLRRTPYWRTVNASAGTTPLRQAARRVRTFLKMARLKAS
jgi:lipopolysaccharide biosynthesis glycosyltransferase